ncbi:MAG: DUF3099 domain-containing protein [bacterium]
MNKRGRNTLDAPIAITSVPVSLDDQFDARRRKYLIMMGLRVVCVLAAVITYPTSIWLALALIVGGAVLPWCAVLIANDRPPKHATTFVRYKPPPVERMLEAGSGSAVPSTPVPPGSTASSDRTAA